MALTHTEQGELAERGYLVLGSFMDAALLDALRTRTEELFAEEGDRAGSEFKQEPGARRLSNLVAKGEIFQGAILMPRILECVAAVLGPEFKLSSLNIRSANPLSNTHQPLHADAGAVADDKGYWVCNTVWMLDDFTADNGAIRMVPGSHRWGKLPQQVLNNASAPHSEETLLTGTAGTVVVMNAHMWHGGTANRTDRHRRALHGFYCRWDKPQQQYQKQLIPVEQQRRFGPELRRLLALDDPLNDEMSSRLSGMSGFLK